MFGNVKCTQKLECCDPEVLKKTEEINPWGLIFIDRDTFVREVLFCKLHGIPLYNPFQGPTG